MIYMPIFFNDDTLMSNLKMFLCIFCVVSQREGFSFRVQKSEFLLKMARTFRKTCFINADGAR